MPGPQQVPQNTVLLQKTSGADSNNEKREEKGADMIPPRWVSDVSVQGPRAQLAQGISSGTWWTLALPRAVAYWGRLNPEPWGYSARPPGRVCKALCMLLHTRAKAATIMDGDREGKIHSSAGRGKREGS